MSKTSSTVKDRYNAKAYDSITLRVPKGQKAVFAAACEAKGESMNGILNDFIQRYIEQNRVG